MIRLTDADPAASKPSPPPPATPTATPRMLPSETAVTLTPTVDVDRRAVDHGRVVPSISLYPIAAPIPSPSPAAIAPPIETIPDESMALTPRETSRRPSPARSQSTRSPTPRPRW